MFILLSLNQLIFLPAKSKNSLEKLEFELTEAYGMHYNNQCTRTTFKIKLKLRYSSLSSQILNIVTPISNKNIILFGLMFYSEGGRTFMAFS